MLNPDLPLNEVFVSSGSSLRVNSPRDYANLSAHLIAKRIHAERQRLEVLSGGLLERLHTLTIQHKAIRNFEVWDAIPKLRVIENKGGKLHEILCFAAATWLSDRGFIPQSEVWANERQVDLATTCKT